MRFNTLGQQDSVLVAGAEDVPAVPENGKKVMV
jgi:hypothetical protein